VCGSEPWSDLSASLINAMLEPSPAHRLVHLEFLNPYSAKMTIRLLDGSRAYLHAVIDNFSRRILGWKVTPTFDPAATAEILLAAAKGLEHGTPSVLVDGGVQNFNGPVDGQIADLLGLGRCELLG
jgi:transposase InsO family protein